MHFSYNIKYVFAHFMSIFEFIKICRNVRKLCACFIYNIYNTETQEQSIVKICCISVCLLTVQKTKNKLIKTHLTKCKFIKYFVKFYKVQPLLKTNETFYFRLKNIQTGLFFRCMNFSILLWQI